MCLKYKEIIEKMTLEEKARMLSGKNTWETVGYEKYGIPSIVLSDGPNGLRRQLGAGDQLGIHGSAPATCSGRLNETYPVHYQDVPNAGYYPSPERSSEFREGLYVGYRYYLTVKKKVRFPFGYGLSYTTFAYQNLTADAEGASFTVTNTGTAAGTEIPQLYVGRTSDTVFRPVRELKGFARVTLEPGESRNVRIPFDDKTFRLFCVNLYDSR